jgi:hypothetical protein
MIKKDHFTNIAAMKAAQLKRPIVGKILCKGSTKGAVILKIACDRGLKKVGLN